MKGHDLLEYDLAKRARNTVTVVTQTWTVEELRATDTGLRYEVVGRDGRVEFGQHALRPDVARAIGQALIDCADFVDGGADR